MTTIKDSVHGHIAIDGVGAALLDAPPLQRLRYIRQLGTVQLVYPSANHTRFEHSLGVYHLARRALDHLGIEGRSARRVEAAALLHDVGHPPFSHNLEPILRHETGGDHDVVDHLLSAGPIDTILASHDLDPDRVARLVRGSGTLGQLVAGELDVDRMDYLVRDAHHTGVPYGTIDPGRLLRELTVVDDEIALAEGNVQSAENLLIARSLMNPTVYNHHVARISKAMLRRAVWRLALDGDLGDRIVPTLEAWPESTAEISPMRMATDHDVLVALAGHDATAALAHRLLGRRLYKRAVWAERDSVPDDLLELGSEAVRELESTIARRADVSADEVIVDIPAVDDMDEAASKVIVNGRVSRLYDRSPLVQALQASHRAQWRLGVYAPTDTTGTVGEAAVSVLGLEVDGPLITHRSRGIHRPLTEFESP